MKILSSLSPFQMTFNCRLPSLFLISARLYPEDDDGSEKFPSRISPRSVVVNALEEENGGKFFMTQSCFREFGKSEFGEKPK